MQAVVKGGHEMVVECLNQIQYGKITTPTGQNRHALIRFNEPVVIGRTS